MSLRAPKSHGVIPAPRETQRIRKRLSHPETPAGSSLQQAAEQHGKAERMFVFPQAWLQHGGSGITGQEALVFDNPDLAGVHVLFMSF